MALGFLRRKKRSAAELMRELGDADLPVFPAIVTGALSAIRDEQADLGPAVDGLAADPGVSVKLLSTVNSAAFGLRHEVRSIHHAAALLGRNQLESLLICCAVNQALPRVTTRGFDPSRFWTAAARRAAIAARLADLIDPATRSESFTAALLEDMAIPLLAQRRTEEYDPVLIEHHAPDGPSLIDLEHGRFDWDHAQIGGAIAESWDFPNALAVTIGAHHDEDGNDEELLAGARLVAELRESDPAEGVDALIESAFSEYGVPHDQTRQLVESCEESIAGVARMFG